MYYVHCTCTMYSVHVLCTQCTLVCTLCKWIVMGLWTIISAIIEACKFLRRKVLIAENEYPYTVIFNVVSV